MLDISKCTGGECPIKDKCYRFKAKESEYMQAYFSEIPFKNGDCSYFIKVYKGADESKK